MIEEKQAIAGVNILEELKKAAIEHIDVPGFTEDLMDKIVLQALKNIVASTENTIDDAIAGVLGPLLIAEVNKLVKQAWEGLEK